MKKNILKGIVIIIIFGVIFLMLNDGKYKLFPKKNITNDIDKNEFLYQTEQFADLKMIRYRVPGFEELDLRQKN